ncbi:MAG: hypothetical protein ACXWR0_19600, partial [Bdellovibrio sp.]
LSTGIFFIFSFLKETKMSTWFLLESGGYFYGTPKVDLWGRTMRVPAKGGPQRGRMPCRPQRVP